MYDQRLDLHVLAPRNWRPQLHDCYAHLRAEVGEARSPQQVVWLQLRWCFGMLWDALGSKMIQIWIGLTKHLRNRVHCWNSEKATTANPFEA